jgi:hypothetical protein
LKKISLILLIAFLPFSCQKEKVNIDDIKGTRDLKDLSLPRLKAFLDGK